MAELVYEMLWDCRYCGAKKLLGLTHRHCPNCGAEQDANARYFPADTEKVAVQDHQYVGVDVQCRFCGGASSRRAHNCGQCGAPLVEGAPVATAASRSTPASVRALGLATPLVPPPRAAWKIILPIAALLTVAVVVLLVVWKKEQGFVVAAHSWRRSIGVERFSPVRESAWCDALPSGASDVSRHREQHGSKRVPDGEDCHVQKKDRGDGTFKEERVCTPKLKEEPVYEDKCDYELMKWSKLRSEEAQGEALSPPPRWPAVTLTRAGCSNAGCEREGPHDESYTVVFRDEKGETYRCSFAEPLWASFSEGRRYRGALRSLVGTLDCASLVAGK